MRQTDPGDVLIAAVDMRGHYPGDSDNFPAFLGAPPERLRGDLALLPELAEDEASALRRSADMLKQTALSLG